ncbi:MAG TPA: PIN domain-containing protein [Acidobacteriaceae bacterium]|jgi:predicted nucleic acid-binding protein|nr:PIN domain-containing protein [Acidobacteriaceae bacterium]
MSRVFWDTNLFIYLFEDYGKDSERVAGLRQKMLDRQDELVTSALTIGEILVKPSSAGDDDLCQQYEDAIRSTAIVVDFDIAVARQYAKLRARQSRKIAPPDAIQLACAAAARVDLFLTNDTRLHDLRVEGIHFITSVERAPL